jgi:hypothetical protein
LKLWLLDADVIIDLFGLDVFDRLLKRHEVYVASTVIDEVRFYIRAGQKTAIGFRQNYVVNNKLINEVSATTEEIQQVLTRLPTTHRDSLHTGELESLAILLRDIDLIFCSCDAATIRALPLLDLSERGVSVESLLRTSGLSRSDLRERHADAYFKNNLSIGQQEKVRHFGR